jgi:hypothetical protein
LCDFHWKPFILTGKSRRAPSGPVENSAAVQKFH